jgi:hypothetical protein
VRRVILILIVYCDDRIRPNCNHSPLQFFLPEVDYRGHLEIQPHQLHHPVLSQVRRHPGYRGHRHLGQQHLSHSRRGVAELRVLGLGPHCRQPDRLSGGGRHQRHPAAQGRGLSMYLKILPTPAQEGKRNVSPMSFLGVEVEKGDGKRGDAKEKRGKIWKMRV